MDFAMHTIEQEPPLVWDEACGRLRCRGKFWSAEEGQRHGQRWTVSNAARVIEALGFMVRNYGGVRDILRPTGGTVAQGLTGSAMIGWAKRAYRDSKNGGKE